MYSSPLLSLFRQIREKEVELEEKEGELEQLVRWFSSMKQENSGFSREGNYSRLFGLDVFCLGVNVKKKTTDALCFLQTDRESMVSLGSPRIVKFLLISWIVLVNFNIKVLDIVFINMNKKEPLYQICVRIFFFVSDLWIKILKRFEDLVICRINTRTSSKL